MSLKKNAKTVGRRGKRMGIHYINNLGKLNGEGPYLYRFSFKGKVFTGSTGCPRYEDALTYLNKIKGDLALGTIGIKKRKIYTFNQAYQSWLKLMSPQLAPNYIRNIKTRLEHHALPLIGGRVLDEIDRACVLEVCNMLIEKGGAKSSANLLGLQIGTVLTHAHEMKWIQERPRIKVIKAGQKKYRPVVSKAGLDDFLYWIDAREDLDFSFMIRAMIYMGMRSDEVVKMKWATYLPSSTTYIADVTKNQDAPAMPIQPKMLEWFEKLREERKRTGLVSPWICPSPRDPKKHRSRGSCTSMLLQVAEKLELGRLTRHRLRASFATILHQSGVPIKTIQMLMRHKRVETTMLYIQVDGKELQEAVNQAFA